MRKPIDLSVPLANTPSTNRYAPPPLVPVKMPTPEVPAFCVTARVPPLKVGEAPAPNAQPVGSEDVFEVTMLLKFCEYKVIAAFAALAAIIAQVPAARRVMVFMFFMLSVLSIV